MPITRSSLINKLQSSIISIQATITCMASDQDDFYINYQELLNLIHTTVDDLNQLSDLLFDQWIED